MGKPSGIGASPARRRGAELPATCAGGADGSDTDTEARMLYWALIFLIIALVAAALGFGGIAAGAGMIARVLFLIFLVLFLVALVMGLMRRGTPL